MVENIIKEKIKIYTENPEDPMINYELGLLYYHDRYFSSALNFFLRAAELSKDKNLIYHCLLLCSNTLYRQGNRNHSKTGFILHAISVLKRRPEAWFLLLRHCEENGQWQECYTYSSLALDICDFNLKGLTYSDYPGEWAIEFIMAKAAYQIGRSTESRRILRDIISIHWNKMDQNYQNWVLGESNKLGDKESMNRLTETSHIKTSGFPKARFTSLKESGERRNILNQSLRKYKIQAEPFIAERMKEGDFRLIGKNLSKVPLSNLGATVTHLRLIDDWYKNTDDPYLVVFEDDVMLETIDYWNFDWLEFFNNLPEDWEAVQLCLISESDREIKFCRRNLHDWGAQAYLISRDFAKKIIDSHIRPDHFIFEIPNYENLNPVIEHMLFDGKGVVYNFPLFVENAIRIPSTYENNGNNLRSHFRVLDWWKNNKKTITEILNC